jgi:hypothetical protein
VVWIRDPTSNDGWTESGARTTNGEAWTVDRVNRQLLAVEDIRGLPESNAQLSHFHGRHFWRSLDV